MTPLSIAVMIVAMLILWGGLVVAITFLAKHPLEDDDDSPSARPGPSRSPRG
jgi:hypothetical protein